jgi:hypothetical protein
VKISGKKKIDFKESSLISRYMFRIMKVGEEFFSHRGREGQFELRTFFARRAKK